jgi:thymidine kinase
MSNYHNLDGGYLHLLIGPMYCGKTTEMLRKLNIYAEMGCRVLYVNTKLDNRSNDDFSTHSNYITNSGKIKTIQLSHLSELQPIIEKFDVIGIDEAQMFKDLKTCVLNIVEKNKKTVVVAGLNGDFLRRPFGEILDLIPVCDTVKKLYPFCISCCKEGMYTNAIFSKRIVESTETILIGSQDSYIPVCRKCYHK